MVKTKLVVSGQIQFENKKHVRIQRFVISIVILYTIGLFTLPIDYLKTLLPDSDSISNNTVQKSNYNRFSSSSSSNNHNSSSSIESDNVRYVYLTELERIDSVMENDISRTVHDTVDEMNKQISTESGQLENDSKSTINVSIVSNDTNNVNNTISTTDVPVDSDKQIIRNETVKLENNETDLIFSNDTKIVNNTIPTTVVSIASTTPLLLNNESNSKTTNGSGETVILEIVNITIPKTDAVPKATTLLMNEKSIDNTTKTVSLFTLNDEWKKVTAKSLTSFGTNIQRTIEYNQKDSAHMGPFTDSGINGKYCSTILQKMDNTTIQKQQQQQQTSYTWDNIPTTMINITFSCGQLFNERKAVGTGNFISLFYAIRLIAIQCGNIDITIQCSDANITKDRFILPWLTGSFPRTDWTQLSIGSNNEDTSNTSKKRLASERTNPTMVEACYPYAKSSIGYIVESSVYELRRMAIALVGIPSKSHPAYEWAEQYLWSTEAQSSIQNLQLTLPAPRKDDVPLLNMSNFEIDDVAIHFRCGDIMNSRHPSFGFMKFESFSRYINTVTTKSIGIVTSPLEPSTEGRVSDKGKEVIYRCKKVINLFVQHLNEKISNNVTITIRNDPIETIAATYARMIMAKQTIIGISSFGVFGGLATFGTGYIRKPDYPKAPNRFLVTHPNISQLVPNVHLISEPRLMAEAVKGSWPKDDGASVIRWFQNYNVTTLN